MSDYDPYDIGNFIEGEYYDGQQDGAATEKEQIMKWLRAQAEANEKTGNRYMAQVQRNAAKAIENDEHWSEA